ncbi:unnamed protein product [Somion occarium]|uniref:DUF6697 domain-containing protein n=1 Tax=Somion occarium TaxID=3059160 RepID=A0ABP1E9H5_9APHY
MLAESRDERNLQMFVPPQISMPGLDDTSYATHSGLSPFSYLYSESKHLGIMVTDALIARDVTVQRLQTAVASIRDKELTIATLEREKKELQLLSDLGNVVLDENKASPLLKERTELLDKIDQLEKSKASLLQELIDQQKNDMKRMVGSPMLSPNLASASVSPRIPAKDSHDERLGERYAILSELAIPIDMPSDTLLPIVIPPPFNVHDFIGTVTGPFKSQLANYRVFQEYTTSWCPDREEHGYFLSPVFKCMTNPRASTAHRWVVVDLASKMNQSMECFYNKEGKWYYAGVYKAFRLDDLSTSEWDKLTPEASQAVIKETLAARKGTSPQNGYETGQLYAAGALKVACIGLQCIGFDTALYKGLLEQADVCSKSGRWRAPPVAGLGNQKG